MLAIKMAEGKPKLGARLTRAAFVGNLVGALMFVVFYLTMTVINGIGNTTVMQPVYAGIFGWITGMSASIGIELSKDLE